MKKTVTFDFLKQLNPEQKEAVLTTEGPVLVLAGAGTGKTRIITYRIAYLISCGVEPYKILAVTFTNKAAQEMQTRIEKLLKKPTGVWISTFHSLCSRILRIEHQSLNLPKNFLIYDEEDSKNLLKESLHELQYDAHFKPSFCLNLIQRAKDELIDAESYRIISESKISQEPYRKFLKDIYLLYQKKLTLANALDFGDLILKTVELLRYNENLKSKYSERFSYIMVDEYQDTNRAQYILTKLLSAKHRNLLVVGDDDQSIYSWRGADIRNILDFEKEYPETKIIKLQQNYRSTQTVLDTAWKLISHNKMRKDKKLWTLNEKGKSIVYKQLDNEVEEAEFVADEIKKLSKEYSYNSFAVFYRTNAQSRVFENILNKKNIPYRLIGTVRFFDRMEIKDLISYLRVVVNPNDDYSIKRIIERPPRGIGKNTLNLLENISKKLDISLFDVINKAEDINLKPAMAARLKNFAKMLQHLIFLKEQLSLKEFVKLVIKKSEYIEYLEKEGSFESKERIANIKEFVNIVDEVESKDLETFLEQISLQTEVDRFDNKKTDLVTLMTAHLAKGLEFPVVFITGLEEGLFPIGESTTNNYELEEERRLCYVAMTRAKKLLYLLSATTRKIFGTTHWNLPSRFIQECGVEQEEDGEVWDVGQEVNHPHYGKGRIIGKEDAGSDLKVVVLFETGIWRKFFVNNSPLKPI